MFRIHELVRDFSEGWPSQIRKEKVNIVPFSKRKHKNEIFWFGLISTSLLHTLNSEKHNNASVMKLIHELSEDHFNRRTQLFEEMMDKFNDTH